MAANDDDYQFGGLDPLPDPGEVLVAEVFDGPTLVGVLWAAVERRDGAPGAGAIPYTADTHPSISELGYTLLNATLEPGWNPAATMDYWSSGWEAGKAVEVGPVRRAETLREVQATAALHRMRA
jgi:hypothetical protein